MSATPSATKTARLCLLVAAEERQKARELEDAKEVAALAREMRLIDEAERAGMAGGRETGTGRDLCEQVKGVGFGRWTSGWRIGIGCLGK